MCCSCILNKHFQTVEEKALEFKLLPKEKKLFPLLAVPFCYHFDFPLNLFSSPLIIHPFALQSSVRNEVMATSHVTDEWMTLMEMSSLNCYIVRRYIATPSGVLRIYPGSLMDKAFDPTRRQWWGLFWRRCRRLLIVINKHIHSLNLNFSTELSNRMSSSDF